MTEKILSLEKLSKEELRTIDNHKLEKIYNDLKRLHFFDNRNFAEGDKMVFYILKLNPNQNGLGENGYIRENCLDNDVCFKSELYDFNLHTISKMG